MNYGTIAIFDCDFEYANCLADYFRLKGCLSSEIVVFTKPDSFIDYSKKHDFDILLINEQFMSDTDIVSGSNFPKHNIFTLCENKIIAENDAGICLFKYTSAEAILCEVMSSYKPTIPGVTIPFRDRHKSKIIGVYSPVNRCGKTSFALALALHYSRVSSCLFISFDNYSPHSRLVENFSGINKSIDDLLYYYAGSPDSLDSRLLSVVRKIQELDFISPSIRSCSIGEMNSSEQVQFLQALINAGHYDYIFADFGSLSPVFPLLELCKTVFLPYIQSDAYSESVINHFMDSLKNITSDNSTSYQKISPPVISFCRHGSDYIYTLTSGEMADFITSLDDLSSSR